MANSKPNKNAPNILVIQLDQMMPLVLPAYGRNDVFFKKFGEGLVPFPPPAPASLRGDRGLKFSSYCFWDSPNVYYARCFSY